jgi:hypothetical protein
MGRGPYIGSPDSTNNSARRMSATIIIQHQSNLPGKISRSRGSIRSRSQALVGSSLSVALVELFAVPEPK